MCVNVMCVMWENVCIYPRHFMHYKLVDILLEDHRI